MGFFTTYLQNIILDWLHGGQSYTPPATVYLGLATGVTKAGVITGEPSGNGYARIAIVNNNLTSFWSAASGGTKTNGHAAVTFNQDITNNWGTMSYWFTSDALTGGNILEFGTTGGSNAVVVGQTPYIGSSNLNLDGSNW